MQLPIKRKKHNEDALMNIEGIRNAILKYVSASPARRTPQFLKQIISETYGLDRAHAKAALKDLVARSELEYTYEFGSTYLVPAFNKPVRISAHVVVKPPGQRYRPLTDDVVIQINPGAAFGGGRHPTTRLSVNAIEFLLNDVRPSWLNENCCVLDIGTGSGILAIAAVCLGVKKGLGIDIDPCAIVEAGHNLNLNHLQDRIVISDRKIQALDSSYSLVIANLRYPSLKSLYPQITKRTDSGGWAVLSGFRPHERNGLMDLYTANHFACVQTAAELDWAAALLKRI
jgi:ribosomal protein L11 methyltransferase